MLKKLFVTAAAAAAVSVPLAGMAWADPPDDTGKDGGIGQGGIPQRVNEIAASQGLPDPNGPDEPNPPGSIASQLKDTVCTTHCSTPQAYGTLLNVFYPGVYPDKTHVGMGVKASGPGCNRGHTAATDPGSPNFPGNCPR
jgi:hypothetical protein